MLQYEHWLAGVLPSAARSLNSPATSESIAGYEHVIETRLVPEIIELWSLHDGEGFPEPGHGVIGGLIFLPVQWSLKEWTDWANVRSDASSQEMNELKEFSTSYPPESIRLEYTSGGWIPLFMEHGEVNYLGVDLFPGATGTTGQVINFGRDEDDKVVIASSLSDLMSFIVGEALRSEFEVETFSAEAAPYLVYRPGRLLTVLRDRARRHGPVS